MGFEPRITGSEEAMKVNPRDESNGQVTAANTESVRPVETTRSVDTARTASEPQKATTVPDTVSLSGELRLADEAVRAAALSGDVRPKAIARARALLQSGTLGSDTQALADKIIDSLIETRGQRF
jgi:anti-sigma28 factor (negative regulator of flagellin synthesis)